MTTREDEIRGRLADAQEGEWDTSAFPDSLPRADVRLFAHAPADLAYLLDRLETIEHVRSVERAEWMAEVARLRAAMPTDAELIAIRGQVECAGYIRNDRADMRDAKAIAAWLARIDEARKEGT